MIDMTCKGNLLTRPYIGTTHTMKLRDDAGA
jgi:hypothetical protein